MYIPGAAARYVYPLSALVRRELQKRYATTWLGTALALLQPLMLVGIYTMVFVGILHAQREAQQGRELAFFMLAGFLPYLALAEGLQRACSSLREDRSLLEREGFPAEVVPAARIVSAVVPELAGMAVLCVAARIFGTAPWGWDLLALPLLMVLRLVVTIGLGLVLSVLAVFTADVAEVLSFALTAWLFLTQVFYAPEQVPAALSWTLELNVLHHVVAGYRAVVLGSGGALGEVGLLALWAAGFGAAGWLFFRRSVERARDFL